MITSGFGAPPKLVSAYFTYTHERTQDTLLLGKILSAATNTSEGQTVLANEEMDTK